MNAILLDLIPYVLVTAIHDRNVHTALILGTAFSGALLLLGLALRLGGGYKTWPFLYEACMLVVFAVLLGVSYDKEYDIWKYLPFIANSLFATFAFFSLLFGRPFTLQYVREFVPRSSKTHDKVWRSARYTTTAWTLAFVANTLLYLIPICRDKYDNHSNALNLLFRIIVPILLVTACALFTRIWPFRVLWHLRNSQGFDSTPCKVIVNPLALEEGYRPALGPPPPITIHAVT